MGVEGMVALKKLMIRTWFGSLPEWTSQFARSVGITAADGNRHPYRDTGWEFHIVNDEGLVRRRIKEKFGIDIPDIIDIRKPGDYDPYLGVLFEDDLKGYDFWGHFNLDCVYGRLSHWLPDEFLANVDIFGNDPGAICGPFTLYRNCELVNQLFRSVPSHLANLRSGEFWGWDEQEFSQTVNRKALTGNIRFASAFLQAHDHMTAAHHCLATNLHVHGTTPVHFRDDGALIDNVTGQEIMMYHFNQTRKWPVGE